MALLAGAFWYELVGFAHKPMTEFVATASLMALLALCVRPGPSLVRPGVIGSAVLLAVLTAAVRLQYAPLAFLLLWTVFLRTGRKALLVLAASVFALAAGAFDAITWDAGLFHSWLTNIKYNLVLGEFRAGESPVYEYLWWLALASTGAGLLCILAALRDLRRYGLLLALIVLILLVHSMQSHKEYRFIFAVIPLWLLIGADLLARSAASASRALRLPRLAGILFALVSIAGILNTLP